MIKLYADLPRRRSRQILADGLMLAWILLWVAMARAVHAATMNLATPGRTLESAGGAFRDRMLRAGDRVDDLPLVQGRLAEPLRDVSGVGTDLALAGTNLVTAAERLALVAALATALIPILIVGAAWLTVRLRWVHRATTTARFVDSTHDVDLFALRAMARQPMTALARISDDPAGSWRRGDIAVITALAELELADTGLRRPVGPPTR